MSRTRPAQTAAQPAETEMPEGWASAPIGSVVELNPAKLSKDALPDDARVSFVPMPAVDADQGAITGAEERAFLEVRKGYTCFRDGDVIMAKITPCMENGKAAIARGLVNGVGFGSTEFHVLRPSEAVLAEYLFHYIRQESFRKDAEANMTGSVGQKRVPADFLAESELALPPLPEQKRIVAKVEKLLERVAAARERLAKAPAILKRLRQSILAAACSGRLTEEWREQHREVEDATTLLSRIVTERAVSGQRVKRAAKLEDRCTAPEEELPDLPPGWAAAPIVDLLDYERTAGYGVLQPGADVPNGVPMVRVCDLQAGTVLVDQLKRIAPAIDRQYSRTRLMGGEVLVSLVGTIGRTAVAPGSVAGANIARAIGMLPLCPHVLPQYVSLALSEPSRNVALIDLAREVARKTLNLGLLRQFVIALPPQEEQREIVRRVEVLFRLADEIERRVATAAARADRLTQAILAKAFRGELVPTEAELARREGRSFESAEELLKRIRPTGA